MSRAASDSKSDQQGSPSSLLFDATVYDRRAHLTDKEKAAVEHKVDYPGAKWSAPEVKILQPLFQPVLDVLDFAGCESEEVRRWTRRHLLLEVHRRGTLYWAWVPEEWEETIRLADPRCRAHTVVLAYLLGGLDGLKALKFTISHKVFARRAFGTEQLEDSRYRVREVLTGWEYKPQGQYVDAVDIVTCQALLISRSPHLESISADTIQKLVEANTGYRRSAVGLLSRVLAALGVLNTSIQRVDHETAWDLATIEGDRVPEEWLNWCQRWRDHSTLRSRDKMYIALLKVGRWLAEHHPEATTPERWDEKLATEFVAAVDRMKVGEWASRSWVEAHPGRVDKPLTPRSKDGLLGIVKTFFANLQEWGWIPARFNPGRCLRTPRSIRNLFGPDPKPIDPDVWAKLVKAALEVETEDFLEGHRYPIAMNRALSALWICSGLRSDEIVRLRVGCVRWQQRDVTVSQTGEVLERDSVCFLDVPVNKTSTAFTKPMPPVVGRRIEEWQRERAENQNAMLDETTGEMVHFLFSIRNWRLPNNYINNILIPVLCRRAGVPESDSRGKITSHRARATIVSQLNNGPEPWPLADIQAFLGHTTPASTRHYVEVDPNRLAKKFADSGYLEKNLATVEALLDVDALANGQAEEALYYDLGHGLCSNPYWAKCPYRMACVKCPMYVPEEQAQYVRAKESIRRMTETISLSDDEKRAAEGDEQALENLVSKNSSVPIPPSRSSSEQPLIPLTRKDNNKNKVDGK